MPRTIWGVCSYQVLGVVSESLIFAITPAAAWITRNVLDDLGFSPEQAIALKFKAKLYQAILKYAQKYSQKNLQVILGEPQPRVSELLNGKIANKSVDKLLHYAGRLGIEAKAKFSQAHKEVVEKELATA
jgi:predicted XRE-type DNA-binding protein